MENFDCISGSGAYDIGLVGAYTARNYGGTITQLALHWVLKDMGARVLRIERPLDAAIKPFEKPVLLKTKVYEDDEVAPLFPNKKEMMCLNDQCKMFLIGSDQVFNNYLYNAFGRFITLDWVRHDKKKVAYACSYGFDFIFGSDWDRAVMSHDLKLFDAISVREQSGVEISKREFGIEVDVCIDPVFLCPKERYLELARNAEDYWSTPCLGAYILDPSEKKQTIVEYVRSELGCPLHVISDAEFEKGHTKTLWNIPIEEDISLEQWLSMIANCDFLVTDSFHGVCFALIFHKRFIAIQNDIRGKTRFDSILGLTELADRLIAPEDPLVIEKLHSLLETDIDFDVVDRILSKECEKSMQWLKRAIYAPDLTKRSMDDYDIIERRCDWIEGSLNSRVDNCEKLFALVLQLQEKQKKLEFEIGQLQRRGLDHV